MFGLNAIFDEFYKALEWTLNPPIEEQHRRDLKSYRKFYGDGHGCLDSIGEFATRVHLKKQYGENWEDSNWSAEE